MFIFQDMQIQKTEIVKKIIDTSKKEFVTNGFQKTSMRRIAQISGIGLSNIYNYFTNKDQIFETILKPLLAEIKLLFEEHNSPEKITDQIFYSDDFQKSNIKVLIHLVKSYQVELDLLFFKAEGSNLANYQEKLIALSTRVSNEYLEKMKNKYPNLNSDISNFFIHNISVWWVNILIEIVMHDLENDELEKFISEYVKYSTAGWKALMDA